MGATQQLLLAASTGAFSTISNLRFSGADGSTTITDDKGLTWTANGNAQLNDDTIPSGAVGSLLLDGTGDYITTPSTGITFPGGEVTFDGFIRPTVINAIKAIFSTRTAAPAGGYTLNLAATGEIVFTVFDGAGNVIASAISTTAPVAINTYQHFAVTREIPSAIWRVFVGGVVVASATQVGSLGGNNTLFHVGRDPSNSARDFAGRIAAFRVTRGCLWTANFTPPTLPLTVY